MEQGGMPDMRVTVIDIGKPGKNLGWTIDEPIEDGTGLDECIDALAVALGQRALALGFEAPQFSPAARRSDDGRRR